MAHATFTAGDLTAVIGDNSAQEQHRAGYNGVWSLVHRSMPERSLFVPGVAGLNLEHIINGQEPLDSQIFFEPRNAAMAFRRLSETEGELHQPPTPTFHVESWTRFKLVAPDYLDMEFRCMAHQHVFPRGYLGLFWASYINAPDDKSMYFLGGPPEQREPLWTQLCTQTHNRDSTVRHRDDTRELSFAEGRDALYKNVSRLEFAEPFFYGRFDDLTWAVMFDRADGIRLTHSPSGGGLNAARRTTNPAWDFQFIVPDPDVGKPYSFSLRTLLRPRYSRQDLVAEYGRWRQAQ